jgi:hypothetical protein
MSDALQFNGLMSGFGGKYILYTQLIWVVWGKLLVRTENNSEINTEFCYCLKEFLVPSFMENKTLKRALTRWGYAYSDIYV